MEEKATRINKYLSEIGYCSRREADKLIAAGRIKINGKVVAMGQKLLPGDELNVNGKKLMGPNKNWCTWPLTNRGIVCTTDTVEKDNIIDYINYPTRIFLSAVGQSQ